MSTPKTRDREFGSLLQIKDQFPKYVLSLDDFDFSQDGVIHKNLIDFLLE
jgi:predicted AAA+ superfamily ATPase